MDEEYEYDTPEYEEDLEEQVDNDEMDANEAAFMQGYDEDENESFKDKEEKEESD
jgi:hypothetical protein